MANKRKFSDETERKLSAIKIQNGDVETWAKNLEFMAKKQAFNTCQEFRSREALRIFENIRTDQKGAK